MPEAQSPTPEQFAEHQQQAIEFAVRIARLLQDGALPAPVVLNGLMLAFEAVVQQMQPATRNAASFALARLAGDLLLQRPDPIAPSSFH